LLGFSKGENKNEIFYFILTRFFTACESGAKKWSQKSAPRYKSLCKFFRFLKKCKKFQFFQKNFKNEKNEKFNFFTFFKILFLHVFCTKFQTEILCGSCGRKLELLARTEFFVFKKRANFVIFYPKNFTRVVVP